MSELGTGRQERLEGSPWIPGIEAYNFLSFSLINSSFNIHILGESNGKSVIGGNPTRKRLILVYVITTEFERVIVTDIQTHFENKSGVSTLCYCHLPFSLSSKTS